MRAAHVISKIIQMDTTAKYVYRVVTHENNAVTKWALSLECGSEMVCTNSHTTHNPGQ